MLRSSMRICRSPLFSCLTVLGLLCLPLSSARGASNDDSDRDDSGSHAYNGAFFEPSVRGGWTVADTDDITGWGMDVGARYAHLFSIVDLRLAYRLDSLDPSSSSTDDASRQFLHSGTGHLALHPFALLLLGSDWISYTISGLYFEVGGGLRGGAPPDSSNTGGGVELGGVWSVGAGLDLPLGDPDTGFLPWLHLVYRYDRGTFPGSRSNRALELHTFFAGIGLRTNGTWF